MALPALDKTYQYARGDTTSTVNVRLVTTGNANNDQKTVLLRIINDLIGFGTLPWTVIGSANGAGSFGMDAVNRWDAISKLVFVTNAGTAHSWIVLQQSGIATKCQIVFDLISPTGGTNSANGMMVVYCSPAAGFGVANGGTDGTNTARPTATDEFAICYTAGSSNFLDAQAGGSATARDYLTSVVQSTDGQVTRVLIRIPGTRWSAYFCVEKPKNPVTGWTNPVIGRWFSATTSILTYANYNDVANVSGRSPGGVLMPLYLSCEGYIAGMHGEQVLVPNEISNAWEMLPVGLVSTTTGSRGLHGRLFDAYWVSTQHADGDTFPADGTRTWLVVGDIAIPWNGSLPVLA